MWKVKMFLKKVLLIDRQWEMDTDFAAAVLYVPWLRKLVLLVGSSRRAPLKRKPWCPHICVVVHFKYFELNFYLRWLRYKMWWMTFELGLIEFFPSLKKGSKSGVARQNLKEKVNWIYLELKIFNCRLCGDAVNRASMEWLDGKRLRSSCVQMWPLLDVLSRWHRGQGYPPHH